VVIPQFFQTIEESGISNWVRDNPFWAILSVHALGMALLVGASTVVDLRLLGFARGLPVAPLKKFYRVIWLGFWVQAASGIFLLIGYPTKSFTNPDFYLKLALIATAMVVKSQLQKRVFSNPGLSETEMTAKGKTLALVSLLLWFGVVTAGRMLAYTYTYISYPGPGELP